MQWWIELERRRQIGLQLPAGLDRLVTHLTKSECMIRVKRLVNLLMYRCRFKMDFIHKDHSHAHSLEFHFLPAHLWSSFLCTTFLYRTPKKSSNTKSEISPLHIWRGILLMYRGVRMNTESRSEIFPFLELPAELRNQVYFEVIVSRLFIRLAKNDNYNYTTPALLQVSRQIRHEARSIYYSMNMFQVASPTAWKWVVIQFLKSLDSTDKKAASYIHGTGCQQYNTDQAHNQFVYLQQDAGMTLDDSVIFMDVRSHVGEGEATCCQHGHCFNAGEYAVHYVNCAQLKTLIVLEKEGGHPLFQWR